MNTTNKTTKKAIGKAELPKEWADMNEAEANAKLIVSSVNQAEAQSIRLHDALLGEEQARHHAEALAQALRDIETLGQCTVPPQNIAGHLHAMELKAREALANWEGGAK